jgi:tetratricopeptide (TPR) repeat protein
MTRNLLARSLFALFVGFAGPLLGQPPLESARSTDPAAREKCAVMVESAKRLFRAGDYDEALERLNEAIAGCGDSAALHEFRGLVRFAKGDYQETSASLHAALATTQGWTWAVLINHYGDPPVYTKQLRALETFARRHPDDSAARFVLAYHYMVTGHLDHATHELEMVSRLEPDDRVALEILKRLPKPRAAYTPSASLTP